MENNITIGYDLIRGNFINNINSIEDINDIEVIKINIYMPSFYYYKWKISYKNQIINNNSGSIQALILNIENAIDQLNGKEISYKVREKLYKML